MTGLTKNRFFETIIFALLLCIFLTIGEVAFRILKPQKTYSELLELVNDMWKPSEFHKFVLKENYEGKYPSNEIPDKYVSISTNNIGLRDDHDIAYEKQKDKKRILIIGDSYSFGAFVDTHEAYPHVLEHILEKLDSNYEVINAGFPGYNADDIYVWLKNEGIKFNPDLIIYGFFIGNDLGIDRNNWILDNEGFPVAINKNKKLGKYVDEFGRIRDSADSIMQEDTVGYEYIYKIPLLRESHFLIAAGKFIQKIYSNLSSAGNSPNTYAVPQGLSIAAFPHIFGEDSYRVREKYKEFYRINNSNIPSQEEREKFFHELVLGMNKIAKDVNSKYVVLMIPMNFQVEPEYFLPLYFREPDENKGILEGSVSIKRDFLKELSQYLESNNIGFINLLNEMKEHPGKYYPRNREMHFNTKGHEFTANIIYEYLANNNHLY